MFSLFRRKKVNTIKAVNEIECAVYQWAKQYGFRKFGRTLNRIVDQDIVQVIHFQNGCPEKRVHGVSWVNLRIRIPECSDFPNDVKKYYQEHECNIRCSLDEYIDKKDSLYDLRKDPQKIAGDIIQKLQDVILPIFDILSSREAIIKERKDYPEFNSFRCHLVDRDINLILRKLGRQ